MEAFRHPEYYDIAFDVEDAGREVDFFEEAIRRFSCVPVRRMCGTACGTAPRRAGSIRRPHGGKSGFRPTPDGE